MQPVNTGLEGVVAAETRLSHVDGLAGELIIGGFPLEELVLNASFEEVTYLLWHDRLPTNSELNTFKSQLKSHRTLPDIILNVLQAAAARNLPTMDALRMGASALSLLVDDINDHEEAALTAVAAFPSIVAAYYRYTQGQNPIAPHSELDHAANYLYMIKGEKPDTEQTRALQTYLNTVSDHGLNASTFTARVIISTQSDIISAITGAIGALKGPLHGGAPGPALDMVFEIGKPENAEPMIREMLERGDRLMGFGHRVYKVRDPRADVLKTAAERFFPEGDEFYALVQYVEQVALNLLEEYKPGRRLQTNVEFYTALVLHGIGLPTDLFSPTFAVGRVGGWTAHAREQLAHGRLIRPASTYTGEYGRKWMPIEER